MAETGPQEEIKLSPADLARSYLGHEGMKLVSNQASAEFSLSHTRTFEPTLPRPTTSDAGGDIDDYNVALGEYNQWPEQREEDIEHWENELENLRDKENDLARYFSRVNKGDAIAIKRFSELEKERRAREKELEGGSGQEFNGIGKLRTELSEIAALIRSGKIPLGKEGPKGWSVNNHHQSSSLLFHESISLDYQKGKGPRFMPIINIYLSADDYSQSRSPDETLSIRDFRDPQEIHVIYGGKYPSNDAALGTLISMKLGKETVISPRTGPVAYYNKPEGGIGEILPSNFSSEQAESRTLPFDQDRFDGVQELVTEMAADLKSIATT